MFFSDDRSECDCENDCGTEESEKDSCSDATVHSPSDSFSSDDQDESEYECENSECNMNYNSDMHTILYSNVDTFLNKKHELLHLLDVVKPDIIGLTEVKPKTKNNYTATEYAIKGYDLFLNENPKRGVALYLDQKLNAEVYILNLISMVLKKVFGVLLRVEMVRGY